MKRLIVVTTLMLSVSMAFAQNQVQIQPQAAKGNANERVWERLPMPVAVHVDRNIVYARYGEQQLMLDLYTPEKHEGKLPGLVIVRGGSWRAGDKEGFAPLAANLATQGFIVACIQYRVFPDIEFPAPIYDLKAAVRWMRAEGASYGIATDAIGALGASAGAHLVALLGTSSGQSDLEGDGGHATQSSRVQAVVALAPVTDFQNMPKPDAFNLKLSDNPELSRKMSPVTYVSHSSPPMLLIHGTADTVIPYAQSEELLADYKAVGASAELVPLPEGHGFWRKYPYDAEVITRAARFFHATLDPLAQRPRLEDK